MRMENRLKRLMGQSRFQKMVNSSKPCLLIQDRCPRCCWLHGSRKLVNFDYWWSKFSVPLNLGHSLLKSDCHAFTIYVSQIRNSESNGFGPSYSSKDEQKFGNCPLDLNRISHHATDIAEVIGAAIALYLLFDIPLIIAVFITVFDVFILLLLTRVGFRKVEAIVVCLIIVILVVFSYQVALSDPNWKDVIEGFIPTQNTFANSPTIAGMTPLTGALGIIGATVMPHNLYLHSSISQSRMINHDDKKKKLLVRFVLQLGIQIFN